MRTAFVFAGGGSVASAEVGMLRALVAHGIQPSFVVGASAGAINAVHFAHDPTSSGERTTFVRCPIEERSV